MNNCGVAGKDKRERKLCHVELCEFEEIPLRLTQMVEMEWEGKDIGEDAELLHLLDQINYDFIYLSFGDAKTHFKKEVSV